LYVSRDAVGQTLYLTPPHLHQKGGSLLPMRRLILVVSTMTLTLLVAGGVALAATIHCPNDASHGSPVEGLYCYGTSAADTMSGSDLFDFMYGKGGADTMHGYGDRDYMQGDKGSDHIYGDAGADAFLWGGAVDPSTGSYTDTSDDYVHGGGGGDTIHGGIAQGGVDRLYGEAGNDIIRASQREHNMNPNVPDVPLTKEIIDCGRGASDEVQFDRNKDTITNCEIKHPFP
jgi:Ca2+-binding RTX toxin-like protein